MPIDVQCIECDSVDVLQEDMDYIKDGNVHEHWICEECGESFVFEIPIADYYYCPNECKTDLGNIDNPCENCEKVNDWRQWINCIHIDKR